MFNFLFKISANFQFRNQGFLRLASLPLWLMNYNTKIKNEFFSRGEL